MTAPRTQFVDCPNCGTIIARVLYTNTWTRLPAILGAPVVQDAGPDGPAEQRVRAFQCRGKRCGRSYVATEAALWVASKQAETAGARTLDSGLLHLRPVPAHLRRQLRLR